MTRNLLLFFAAVLLTAAFSCTYDRVEVPDQLPSSASCDSVSYTRDVLPLINLRCNGCHNGYFCGDFSGYAGLKAAVDNGSFRQRVLIDKTMPSSGALSPAELQVLTCWLDKGAPNN